MKNKIPFFPKTISVGILAALLIAWGGTSRGDQATMENMKSAVSEKIWTSDARVLSYNSTSGGGEQQVFVDFKFNSVSTIQTDFDPSRPFKKVRQEKLSADAAAKLKKSLESLVLIPEIAKEGPAPGGSWYFEIRYSKEAPKILSRREGVTVGTRYFVLNDAESKSLIQVLDNVAPSIK